MVKFQYYQRIIEFVEGKEFFLISLFEGLKADMSFKNSLNQEKIIDFTNTLNKRDFNILVKFIRREEIKEKYLQNLFYLFRYYLFPKNKTKEIIEEKFSYHVFEKDFALEFYSDGYLSLKSVFFSHLIEYPSTYYIDLNFLNLITVDLDDFVETYVYFYFNRGIIKKDFIVRKFGGDIIFKILDKIIDKNLDHKMDMTDILNFSDISNFYIYFKKYKEKLRCNKMSWFKDIYDYFLGKSEKIITCGLYINLDEEKNLIYLSFLEKQKLHLHYLNYHPDLNYHLIQKLLEFAQKNIYVCGIKNADEINDVLKNNIDRHDKINKLFDLLSNKPKKIIQFDWKSLMKHECDEHVRLYGY